MTQQDIRRARTQGNATIITVSGFLEAGKFYEFTKKNNVVEIREIEMKVKGSK